MPPISSTNYNRHIFMVSVRGIEPRFRAYETLFLPLEDTDMERVARIELASSDWKSGIIAIIRHAH